MHPKRRHRILLLLEPSQHLVLNVYQEVLLRAQHTARPAQSDPADERSKREPVLLSSIAAYQGPCAAEARLAMDCDASFGGFHEVDELVNDLHGGGAAVHEVEVVNFEAETGEALLFVGWLV